MKDTKLFTLICLGDQLFYKCGLSRTEKAGKNIYFRHFTFIARTRAPFISLQTVFYYLFVYMSSLLHSFYSKKYIFPLWSGLSRFIFCRDRRLCDKIGTPRNNVLTGGLDGPQNKTTVSMQRFGVENGPRGLRWIYSISYVAMATEFERLRQRKVGSIGMRRALSPAFSTISGGSPTLSLPKTI